MSELPHQPRFPDTRLADEGDDLPLPRRGFPEHYAEPIELPFTADEPREPTHDPRLPASARWARADELEGQHGFREALYAEQAKRPYADESLREATGLCRQQDRARRGELLHAGGEKRRLPHGGIVHSEIVPDRPHDDIARVEANAHLDLEAASRTRLRVPPSDRRLDG